MEPKQQLLKQQQLQSAGKEVKMVKNRGFTLIELLVTVVIMGIAAALALPAMQGFLLNQRAKNVAFELAADLGAARSEALKQNAQITLSANSSSWGNGWTISDPASTTIRSRIALPQSVTVVEKNAATSTTFDPSGHVTPTTFEIRGGNGNSNMYRCVMLTPTGLTRTKPGAC